jgi:hypothetical protein
LARLKETSTSLQQPTLCGRFGVRCASDRECPPERPKLPSLGSQLKRIAFFIDPATPFPDRLLDCFKNFVDDGKDISIRDQWVPIPVATNNLRIEESFFSSRPCRLNRGPTNNPSGM